LIGAVAGTGGWLLAAPGTPVGCGGRPGSAFGALLAAHGGRRIAPGWAQLLGGGLDLREVDFGGDGGAQVLAPDHRLQHSITRLRWLFSTSFR
jgi:hypothetical protein